MLQEGVGCLANRVGNLIRSLSVGSSSRAMYLTHNAFLCLCCVRLFYLPITPPLRK